MCLRYDRVRSRLFVYFVHASLLKLGPGLLHGRFSSTEQANGPCLESLYVPLNDYMVIVGNGGLA